MATQGYIDLPVESGGGGSGVSSLNSLTGALSITNGGGLTVSPSGSNVQLTVDFLSAANARQIWVSIGGNDTTGDGTYNNPYRTVTQGVAAAKLAGPSSTNYINVMLMPGRYTTETSNILIPAWVWIVGVSYQNCYIQVNSGAGNIGLDSGWATGTARGGIINLFVGGNTSVDFDLSALGGSQSGDLQIQNCFISGALNIVGRPGDQDFAEVFNILTFSTSTFDSIQTNLNGAIFSDNVFINSTVADSNNEFQNCYFYGNLTTALTGSNANQLYLAGGYVLGSISQGTGTQLFLTGVTSNNHNKVSSGSLPTIASTVAAGTGSTASLANANDVAGTLNLTTGSSSFSSGTQAIMTFAGSYNIAPIVCFSPANAATAAAMVSRQIYFTASTTTLLVNFGTAETAAGTVYSFHYQIVETQ